MAAAALVFGNSFRVSFRAVVLQLTRRSYWLIKTRLNNNVFSQFERGKTHLNAERPITSVNLCLGGRSPTAEGLSVGSPTFEMTMASSAGEVKKKKSHCSSDRFWLDSSWWVPVVGIQQFGPCLMRFELGGAESRESFSRRNDCGSIYVENVFGLFFRSISVVKSLSIDSRGLFQGKSVHDSLPHCSIHCV